MAIVKKSYAVSEKPTKPVQKANKAPVNLEEAIAARAFELYVQRGTSVSTPEEQVNDWNQAEREIRKKYGLN